MLKLHDFCNRAVLMVARNYKYCNWLLAAGCWLLAAGCWLLAAGCWLLAAGCWLLAVWRHLWGVLQRL
jgi:hypothetical protein